MKMKAQDGHLFAEVTLRDVLERTDVSDMPILSEIKRLYDENAKLRELYETVLADYRSEVAKLRELVRRMARALGIDSEWTDPDWCNAGCEGEFRCRGSEGHEIQCPTAKAMRELGIEVGE